VNATAKVFERHGKSLWRPRQKFMNATAKVCERHGKSLWSPRQKLLKATAEVNVKGGRKSRASFLPKSVHVHSPAVLAYAIWLTKRKQTITCKYKYILPCSFSRSCSLKLTKINFHCGSLETRSFVRISKNVPNECLPLVHLNSDTNKLERSRDSTLLFSCCSLSPRQSVTRHEKANIIDHRECSYFYLARLRSYRCLINQ